MRSLIQSKSTLTLTFLEMQHTLCADGRLSEVVATANVRDAALAYFRLGFDSYVSPLSGGID